MKSKKQLPRHERPEEKVLARGVARLSDAELLAVFIGSGVRGADAKQIAKDLLSRYGSRLLTIRPEELTRVRGIGKAKAARLCAIFELACRLSVGRSSTSIENTLSRVAEPDMQLSLADLLKPRVIDPPNDRRRPFLEFFAGIGLVRYALSRRGWRVAYANDIDPQKCRMYADHFGDEKQLDHCDIHKIDANRIPDATLATASFPCTDLSLAGSRSGIHQGKQSSAFWGFIRVLENMGARRPPIVMLENVTGFLTSHKGKDFEDAIRALNALRYAVDTFIIDAVHFVPQSRKRLFVIGIQSEHADRTAFESSLAYTSADLRTPALVRFIREHPEIDWCLRILPGLPSKNSLLETIIDDLSHDLAVWWSRERADYLFSQMTGTHREQAEKMIKKRHWSYGTVFRRVRHGKCRAELRCDGTAGCLRTPKGGSAKQILFKAGYGKFHVRLLTARECAKLMGADDLTITVSENQALFGLGDAVCVPVIEWIADNYLNPVTDSLETPMIEAIA